jgi:hypothetical protein
MRADFTDKAVALVFQTPVAWNFHDHESPQKSSIWRSSGFTLDLCASIQTRNYQKLSGSFKSYQICKLADALE